MASLVLELQREALNANGSVAHLLRMAFVVARKLNVSDFENWVNLEMNGYKDRDDVPKYRVLTGSVKVFNPYHGWQPLNFADPKWAEVLSTRPVFDPIAKLESLLAEQGKPRDLIVTFVPEVEKELMDMMSGPPLQPATILSRASVQGIIDTVRNAVLEWSLRLESSGVLGENMTFSEEEKQRAPKSAEPAPNTYNAQNMTVIMDMQNSQVQQATTDSTQTYVQAPPDLHAVTTLMTKLREQLDGLNLSADTREEVEAGIVTIEAHSKLAKPRYAIIREALHSIRSVLESGAGGALGTGLVTELTRLLS